MSAAKFGESFAPDSQNRASILESKEDLPDYVNFSRDIRRLLRGVSEGVDYSKSENWPECPQNLQKVDDFFAAAKDAVTEHWQTTTSGLLEQKYQEWLAQIPDTEENQDVISTLKDPQAVDEKLRIQQLDKLEGIRAVLPDAWRTLVLTSSERQLATLSLLRHWLKDGLSDEAAERMHTSKVELELMLDASGVLGKYIDHAYVKQIELADQPGGTEASSLSGESGGDFVYEDRSKGRMIRRAYTEVFPGEWPRIARGLELFLQKLNKLLAAKKLPESYEALPEYIEQLIELYSSKETTPEVLKEMHIATDRKMNELAEAGCPLMFVVGATSGTTGDADKVDVDLRFGLITEGLREYDQAIAETMAIAQSINDDNLGSLEKKREVPKMILNTQPLAFGSNLQFDTTAESGETSIVFHVNVGNAVTLDQYPKVIRKLFPEKIAELESLEYLKRMNNDTIGHEIGHNVMSSEDQMVLDRIGSNSQADILEELKAEAMGLLFVRERMKKMSAEEGQKLAEEQFFAKVMTISGYLANESSAAGSDGEAYYFAGLAIADQLLNQGILVEEGEGYKITDPNKGIAIVSEMAEDILKQFYINKDAKPQDVKNYIKDLRKRAKDPLVSRFVSRLRT